MFSRELSRTLSRTFSQVLLLLALMGCQSVDYVNVRYVHVEGAELRSACDRLIGVYGGCVKFRSGVAEIYAPRPKDVRDVKAMEIIGHEFYCHAWLKQSHTDSQGVRREPQADCVPERP